MRFFNNSQSIVTTNGISRVTVNGKTTIIKGNNICINNGKIIVDGKVYKDDNFKDDYMIQNVQIEGNVGSVSCGGSVGIVGDVNGDIDCGSSVSVKGQHSGSIDCGGSVSIR